MGIASVWPKRIGCPREKNVEIFFPDNLEKSTYTSYSWNGQKLSASGTDEFEGYNVPFSQGLSENLNFHNLWIIKPDKRISGEKNENGGLSLTKVYRLVSTIFDTSENLSD